MRCLISHEQLEVHIKHKRRDPPLFPSCFICEKKIPVLARFEIVDA